MDSSPRHPAKLGAELIGLPQDSLGFVRRECPSCHRVFKVLATGVDGRMVFRRVASRLAHANGEEAQWPLERRTCPYCGAEADDDAWFTAEQRAFLDGRAKALGLEVRYEQLAYLERTLAAKPSPAHLSVRPSTQERPLRAEPDDMRVVPLLCCREELKVSESWLGSVRCFYCGLEHEHGAALWRERLKRLLDVEPG